MKLCFCEVMKVDLCEHSGAKNKERAGVSPGPLRYPFSLLSLVYRQCMEEEVVVVVGCNYRHMEEVVVEEVEVVVAQSVLVVGAELLQQARQFFGKAAQLLE